jgi:hypothetical protein
VETRREVEGGRRGVGGRKGGMKAGEEREETFGKRGTEREGERERNARCEVREEYVDTRIQILAAIAVRLAPPLLYARARPVLFRISVGVSARRIAQCGLGLGACNGAFCQSGRQLHEEKPEEKRREVRWRYKGDRERRIKPR